jgi:ABC-type polysaccharide/polyol phosphate transport system ATPase subunit
MSSTIAVRVENLSKRYRIGRSQLRHDTLRDALVAAFHRNGREAAAQELWALKDIFFEVKCGEIVGIIGRNGAGKSTLLKILSRITEPTTGEAEMHGRVGSLLEVGTGFHPELTGRENIYLNGAILGMRRFEIDRKFDEIVAFSEVEKFLDTPVKRYSSGMYVRLAFAVAAHLEPEILLVDEVLAVGDVAFQRKCLGKMGDVARTGRTVLFVSHNMSAVQRLCTESLLLDTGRVVLKDDTRKVVDLYLSQDASVPSPGQWIDLTRASRTGSGRARFLRARYSRPLGENSYQPLSGEPLDFWVEIASDIGRSVSSLAVTIYDVNGVKLVNADTVRRGRDVTLRPGTNEIQVRLHQLHLNQGTYSVGLWLANPGGDCFDHVAGAFRIQVACAEENGFGVTPGSDGVVACDFNITEL